MTNLHHAYNLATGEIISCPTGNHLKRCVRIINEQDRKYNVRPEWIFVHHKGISAVIAKANRIGKQRLGR